MADSTVPTPNGHRFARRCAIAVAIGIGGVALALFFWYAMYVLLLAFAGVLVAVALRGMALAVSRWTRLKVGAALAVVLVLIVAGFGGVGWMLVPSIARQIDDFADKLPKTMSAAEQQLMNYGWGRQLLGRTTPPSPVGPGASESPNQPAEEAGRRKPASGEAAGAPKTQPSGGNGNSNGNGNGGGLASAVQPASMVRTATRYASLLVQAAVAVLVVFVVGIYLAADPHLYERGVQRLLPHRYRRRVSAVLCECAETLLKWMTAQLIPMTVVGAVTATGLWLLGIKLWLTLGLLAALFNFIPNFGPLISLVPAALFALAESPQKALWVILLYMFAQSLEGYVLTPLVQDRAVKLPPAVTILVQVLMGLLMGGIGVVLAAPLAAAVMVIVKRMYVEDVLGDSFDDQLDVAPETRSGSEPPG
jgi:predicted PurR-regulated permease PerM